MSSTQSIEPWLREILRCPQCKGALTDVTGPAGGDAMPAELHCHHCALAYRVDDGVPVLLVDLARRLGD